MGRAVLHCVLEAGDLTLVGAVTETGDALLGRDAGELAGGAAVGVPLTDERSHGLHAAQVAVDFTLPSATEANLRACVEHGAALVIGTTGLEQRRTRSRSFTAGT
jgi:4-hydroxy-tetrahydrodipicolinate reductase